MYLTLHCTCHFSFHYTVSKIIVPSPTSCPEWVEQNSECWKVCSNVKSIVDSRTCCKSRHRTALDCSSWQFIYAGTCPDLLYPNITESFVALVTRKIGGHHTITHKVKHILDMYFPENWNLWRVVVVCLGNYVLLMLWLKYHSISGVPSCSQKTASVSEWTECCESVSVVWQAGFSSSCWDCYPWHVRIGSSPLWLEMQGGSEILFHHLTFCHFVHHL